MKSARPRRSTARPAAAQLPASGAEPVLLVMANRQQTKPLALRQLRPIVLALFDELKLQRAELGIHFVSPRTMARVNWQYLQHEGSTDVITFDHREPGEATPEATAPSIHGELFICVADAVAQAKEFGATWQAEVVRYVVHGVLHLLGYDDLAPAPRKLMKREENRLVKRLAGRFSFAPLARPAKIRP
jgi:probable rRNA maturation factor